MRFLGLIVIALFLAACATEKSQNELIEGNVDVSPSTDYAADIGNRVWLDENMDGIKQDEEPGISGITMNLWLIKPDTENNAKNVMTLYKTTVTDEEGHYRFDAIDVNNNYLLGVELPLGYGITQKHVASEKGKDWDSDINPQSGLSDSLALKKGRYYYWIDLGLVEDDLSSVGDKVWIDENDDGIKQNDEPGFSDITINLWHVHEFDSSIDRIVASTKTNDRGNFRFSGLFPKFDYKLEFLAPSGYVFSAKNNPKAPNPDNTPNSDWDSDVNPSSGFTDILKLVDNEYNYRVDAALHEIHKDKISISILPKHVELQIGQQANFRAEVSGTDNKSVIWKTNGGMISASGLYTAPNRVGRYTVTVLSGADTSKSATATVDVVAKPKISISIVPAYVELVFGQNQQFKATVEGTENKEVEWQVSGGRIDSNGLFVAPNKAGNYIVWARAKANSEIFATAQVKVLDPNSCQEPLKIETGLAEALRVSLKYYEHQTITCSDMLKVTNLIASYAQIEDIDVLRFAKNMQILHLENNEIENIEALKELNKLQELDLSYNLLSSISALVANQGLNDGDELNIENNCLDLDEESTVMHDIDTLEERGVNVSFGGEGNCND